MQELIWQQCDALQPFVWWSNMQALLSQQYCPESRVYAICLLHWALADMQGSKAYHKWVVCHGQNVALISDTLHHVLSYQVILAHHLHSIIQHVILKECIALSAGKQLVCWLQYIPTSLAYNM